jgi:uncharacterized protein (TIGR00369 family)
MAIVMDAEALNAYLGEIFPQIWGSYRIERADEDGVLARLMVSYAHLRPGGTISGPSMFTLADVAVYCAILSQIGPVELAVTTNASIDFLRKPVAGRDLLASCRVLKLGRRLAVADALIRSEGEAGLVARSSMTYAIPQDGPKIGGLE